MTEVFDMEQIRRCSANMRDIADAVDKLTDGYSYGEAADECGVPLTTFMRFMRTFGKSNFRKYEPKDREQLCDIWQRELFGRLVGIEPECEEFNKSFPEDFGARVKNYSKGAFCTLHGNELKCFVSRYVDGLTFQEIADMHGVSKQWVSFLINSAISRIKGTLDIDYMYLTRKKETPDSSKYKIFSGLRRKTKKVLSEIRKYSDEDICNMSVDEIYLRRGVGKITVDDIAYRAIENGYEDCVYVHSWREYK